MFLERLAEHISHKNILQLEYAVAIATEAVALVALVLIFSQILLT